MLSPPPASYMIIRIKDAIVTSCGQLPETQQTVVMVGWQKWSVHSPTSISWFILFAFYLPVGSNHPRFPGCFALRKVLNFTPMGRINMLCSGRGKKDITLTFGFLLDALMKTMLHKLFNNNSEKYPNLFPKRGQERVILNKLSFFILILSFQKLTGGVFTSLFSI